MSAPQKLTKGFIDALLPGAKDFIVWDTDLKGFALKVTPAGRKVFLVQHRPKGHVGAPRKCTIGKYGHWTVQQARDQARVVLNESAKGIDFGARERALIARRASSKVSELADEFLKKHVRQNRSARETERIFKHDILPVIGTKSIHDVTKHDVIRIIERVADRGAGTMANRVLAAVRKFLNWCVSRGVIDASPAHRVSAPAKERSRERVLGEQEIAAIMRAAERIGYPFGTIVQLLFLTAQRRDEVGAMRWSEIDIDKAVWTIPQERSKNAKGHDVHLSRQAVSILQSMPRFSHAEPSEADHVFTTNGNTPFSGFSKAKAKLEELSGASDWRLHDIRRTVVTHMSQMGIPVHVADKILNHKSGVISGVAAVYQRNAFHAERKQALQQWADKLDTIVHSNEHARLFPSSIP